jgi:hypothetical protein
MTDINSATRIFDELVPYGDPAFMVLKAQLLAEHAVASFVVARVPSFSDELENANSPVRSGLALILLAQALSLRDEVPPTCGDVLWPALKKLNALRNDLAHQLYPNPIKVEQKMSQFIELVSGSAVSAADAINLNQQFRLAAQMLVGFLELDREPFTLEDTRV